MEQPIPSAQAGSRHAFWIFLLAIAGCATLMAVFLRNLDPGLQGGLTAGESAPALEAAGWINGEAPTPEPTEGTIRVLHAWSTNCLPCYEEAVELVTLHEKYRDQGVEFVGITFEPPQRLEDVKKFLSDTGITWVNGYGAEKTFRDFGVEAVPCVWIIDSQGRILWNLDSRTPLHEAIPQALAGELRPQPAAVP